MFATPQTGNRVDGWTLCTQLFSYTHAYIQNNPKTPKCQSPSCWMILKNSRQADLLNVLKKESCLCKIIQAPAVQRTRRDSSCIPPNCALTHNFINRILLELGFDWL